MVARSAVTPVTTSLVACGTGALGVWPLGTSTNRPGTKPLAVRLFDLRTAAITSPPGTATTSRSRLRAAATSPRTTVTPLGIVRSPMPDSRPGPAISTSLSCSPNTSTADPGVCASSIIAVSTDRDRCPTVKGAGWGESAVSSQLRVPSFTNCPASTTTMRSASGDSAAKALPCPCTAVLSVAPFPDPKTRKPAVFSAAPACATSIPPVTSGSAA